MSKALIGAVVIGSCYFLAVVDAGSVTAASHLAHVTQPSLSRQLRIFERNLGINLFTRTGGRLVLSAAGRQFVLVWAYVPPGHNWAERGSVTVADLVTATLLLLTGDYSPRRVLDHWVGQAGLTYSSMLEFGTPQVAQAVAAAGRGIAVVSDDPRFGLQPLDIIGTRGALHIRLYAAWDREHHAAAAIEALAKRLSAYCVARYGPQVAPRRPRSKVPSTGSLGTAYR